MHSFVKPGIFLLSILVSAGLAGCQTSQWGQANAKYDKKDSRCHEGDVEACLDLSTTYLNAAKSGNKKYYVDKSVAVLESACKHQSGTGCLQLAQIRELRGWYGTDRNEASWLYQQALYLFNRECDAGEKTSCFHSGVLTQNGVKVMKDMMRAVDRYEIACDGSMAKACHNLANIFLDEKEAFADKERAIVLLKEACDLDAYKACNQLYTYFALGLGIVDRDMEQSVRYFEKSCSLEPTAKNCQDYLRQKEACRSNPTTDKCRKLLREATDS